MANDTKIDYIVHKIDSVSEKVADINSNLEVHIAKFEAHIEHGEEQKEEIKRNTDILHQNTASLHEHMRRTDLLESYVKKIEDRFAPVELESLRKKAVSEWIKVKLVIIAKIGGAAAALGSIGAAVKLLLSLLK